MCSSDLNSNDYVVERIECPSHDVRMVPITITRHKDTILDGSSNLLLYGYGSYGNSMSPGFSSTRLSLIDRNIIWVTAHIRGGMERGMKWWKEGKLLNKKNTFEDYIAVVGFGHADKLQVKTMVQIQLPKAKFDGQDSVDALSIALCHAYQYKNQDKLKRAISKAG